MRWKPAKAFLLDERNALVHEFALDPACGVTFQDAFAAQAFVALGAPVRVGRYHAQTVRANGLALTVVAHAPPEQDEVELLRRLLAEVQGRFEDRVKDRLDLARREEARLAAQAADVRARVRGVAGLQETITAAHARMAAEAAALAARSGALAAGEASVAAREAALRDVAAKAETLDAREAEATRREEALVAVERGLQEREKGLTALSSGLEAWERELETRERESERFFEELARKVAKNARWERELAKKAETLKEREGRPEPEKERGAVKVRH